MWIAKNSITGVTYGKAFSSIYDCQSFIDNSLGLLEYEFRRVFALEQEFIDEYELFKKTKNKDIISCIGLRIQTAIKAFSDSISDDGLIKLEIEKCFANKKTQREYDIKIDKYVRVHWLKNNIIRCWHTEQKRFADGFDF